MTLAVHILVPEDMRESWSTPSQFTSGHRQQTQSSADLPQVQEGSEVGEWRGHICTWQEWIWHSSRI